MQRQISMLPATMLPATMLPATMLPATMLPATMLPATMLPATMRLALAALFLSMANLPPLSAEEGSAGDAAAADSHGETAPRFSRHVVPLLSRLGCNAGACHGKVKGENGFALSLFGVDPAGDHAALVSQFGGRRVNLAEVDQSLLLLKPLGELAHGGGRLFERGSPEHRLLRDWLAGGAALDSLADSRVTELQLTPGEVTLPLGRTVNFRVEAEFADGSREEVTHLCRFEPVSADVVRVAPDGEAIAAAAGDTAIVVRYGAEPVVGMVLTPGPPAEFPPVAEHNFIDTHILAKLRALNVPPAELCDDLTFLRRASLDLTGALPEPEEVRAFLADSHPEKRARKIDELLTRPGHAAVWATKFCDLLRPTGFDANFGMIETAENRRFYDWIRARLEENLPYDEFAERILTAGSLEDRSFAEWIDDVLAMAEENAREEPTLPHYARRRTLDLYWQRKESTGVKGAVQVAHAFLGLRMECAQCHRHPHDIWSQDDLLSFANFFNQLKGARYPDKKEMPEAIAAMFEELPKEAKNLEQPLKELRDGKLREKNNELNKARDELNRARNEKKEEEEIKQLEERFERLTAEKGEIEAEITALEVRRRRMTEGPKRFGTSVRHNGDRIQHASVSSPLGSQRSEQFRLLGEREPVSVEKEQDPRPLVVAWMRRPENPFFARALVNRVWAHYLGRGLVDPPDHLSPLNPASHPELLEELSRRFVENGYDLHWLHRTIANSRTYQQGGAPGVSDPALLAAGRRNFAFFQIRRLSAELLVDALNHAAGAREEYPRKLYLPEGAKGIEVAGATRREDQEAPLAYAFKIFGRPERSIEVQCDCDRGANATVVQSLYMANHPRVLEKVYREEGRAAELLASLEDDSERMETLFLYALARPPSDDELSACLAYVRERDGTLRAYQDVLWSLLNTREFLLIH